MKKIVCLFFAVFSLFLANAVSISAAAVPHRYYNFDSQGGSYYTEANFTGNYYSNNPTNSNLIVHAECRGGSYANNHTTLYLRVSNGFSGTGGIYVLVERDSNTEHTGFLSADVNHLSYDLIPEVIGYAEFESSGTDSNFQKNYAYGFWGYDYGWDPHS